MYLALLSNCGFLFVHLCVKYTALCFLLILSLQDSKFQFSPSSVSLDQVNRTARIFYTLPPGLTMGRVVRDVRALSLLKPNRRSVAQDSFTVSTKRCPPGNVACASP